MPALAAAGVSFNVTPIDQKSRDVASETDSTVGNSAHVNSVVVKRTKRTSCRLDLRVAEPNGLGPMFARAGEDAFWCCTTHCRREGRDGRGGWRCDPLASDDQLALTQGQFPDGDSALIFDQLKFDKGGNFDPIIIHE